MTMQQKQISVARFIGIPDENGGSNGFFGAIILTRVIPKEIFAHIFLDSIIPIVDLLFPVSHKLRKNTFS